MTPFNGIRRTDITTDDKFRDDRYEALCAWVRQFAGFEAANPVPASVDASFRRYFRVQGDFSAIVMDAPPPQENCRPFITIAGFLLDMGLNVPSIVEADLERGYLLMSDLGSVQYLERIREGSPDVPTLYADALAALSVMQVKGAVVQSELPPYDEKMLRFELSLFKDWLCEIHLGLKFSASEAGAWSGVCDALVESALGQEKVFVHRDFHSRNLMVTDENNPGILDFQDAVEGPLTYDLVSLLKDCYIKWPSEKILQGALRFYEQSELAGRRSQGEFTRDFNLMGMQRHLKACGIFSRLLNRDGKPGYMKDVPRTLSYIVDAAPLYEPTRFVGEFIEQRVLPALGENS
jgi:aminoglycoside/choline kinase family phosphotransferase